RPMPPGAETIWHWEFDPWVLALILIPGVLYSCGWRQVHRQMPHRFGAARLAAFLAGLAALFIAIASPLHAYADLLLTAHMLQHLLLVVFQKWRWPSLHCPSKSIAVEKKANDDIVHLRRFRKADGLADQTF